MSLKDFSLRVLKDIQRFGKSERGAGTAFAIECLLVEGYAEWVQPIVDRPVGDGTVVCERAGPRILALTEKGQQALSLAQHSGVEMEQ